MPVTPLNSSAKHQSRLSPDAIKILHHRREFHIVFHNRILVLTQLLSDGRTKFLYEATSQEITARYRPEIANRIANLQHEVKLAKQYWKKPEENDLEDCLPTTIKRFQDELLAESSEEEYPFRLTCMSSYAMVELEVDSRCSDQVLYSAQVKRIPKGSLPGIEEALDESVETWKDYWEEMNKKDHIAGNGTGLWKRFLSLLNLILDLKTGPKKIRDNQDSLVYDIISLAKEFEGNEIEELIRNDNLVSIRDISEAWRRLNDKQRKNLTSEFKKIEIEDYHKLIFGSAKSKPTVAVFQKWCNENVDNNFESEGILFVAKAMQYFRNHLKINYCVKSPATGRQVGCRVEGHTHTDRIGGEYFEFLLPGRGKPRVTTPAQLPAIKLVLQ